MEKKFRKVCQCENCGNEAEMELVCFMEEVEENTESKSSDTESSKNVKATGTCTNCGNEADMWVDI
jgi:hypothetical protein